eukprot:jgi/Botrbrau1/12659/Bobra.67_1s0024.1
MGILFERYGVRENDPVPISATLIRDCVVVEGDPDAAEEKRKAVRFNDIEFLAMGFRCISNIDHLQGLNTLRKLQLNNNRITSIQNLSHLV